VPAVVEIAHRQRLLVLTGDLPAPVQALQTPYPPAETKQKSKPTTLPPEFLRTLIFHEPDNTHCSGCALKRIGEDISETLDYTPGQPG
jgi:transposase